MGACVGNMPGENMQTCAWDIRWRFACKQGIVSPMRFFYLIVGILLTPVGIAGVILPGLPGTVLLIIAAACFARSSPRLERWLINHPRFGPAIVDWRERGAIPLPSKVIALIAMTGSGLLVYLSQAPDLVKWVSLAALAGAAIFVSTRPH